MSKIEFKSINGNGDITFEFNAAVDVRIINDSGADTDVLINLYEDDTKANQTALLHKKQVRATAERSFKFFAKAGNTLSSVAPNDCWILCNILQERIIDTGKVVRSEINHQCNGVRRNEFLLPDIADHSGQITCIVDDIAHTRNGRDWQLRADGRAIVFLATREPHPSADVRIILDKGVY